MKTSRKLFFLVIILLLVFQTIQPTRNQSEGLGDADISKVYDMPAELHSILQKKCYDCHSNNTVYPWYFNVQPIGWWLAAHVHEGKEHLNFSEFKHYSAKDAAHKLEELAEVTEERSMPLKNYTLLHQGTELTDEDEKAIMDWLKTIPH